MQAVPEIEKVEPTGVGDAFRAGFLAALSWGLGHERAAQLGCLLAVYVVEQVGTQEYEISRSAFLDRCAATYGDAAVADFEPHLRHASAPDGARRLSPRGVRRSAGRRRRRVSAPT